MGAHGILGVCSNNRISIDYNQRAKETIEQRQFALLRGELILAGRVRNAFIREATLN